MNSRGRRGSSRQLLGASVVSIDMLRSYTSTRSRVKKRLVMTIWAVCENEMHTRLWGQAEISLPFLRRTSRSGGGIGIVKGVARARFRQTAKFTFRAFHGRTSSQALDRSGGGILSGRCVSTRDARTDLGEPTFGNG